MTDTVDVPALFPRVALCQLRVEAGQPSVNLARVRTLLAQSVPPPDTLVVLPELWAGGADLRLARAQAPETPALLVALGAMASLHGIYFAGSLPEAVETEEFRCRNTLFLVGPAGVLGRYNKQHLFRPWREDRYFVPGGGSPAPLASPFGPLGALVCYDLRFPELAGHQVRQGAALLLVSALWPAERLEHWRVLLRARAIENQAYVVGCNGCGISCDIALAGHSLVVAPDGEVLLELDDEEGVGQTPLQPQLPAELRERFCPAGERPWQGDDGDKVVSLEEALDRLRPPRTLGSRIVFTNGCFDLLHSGHVRYLQAARRAGDFLVLGLNSDRSVRALKGPSRPVNVEADRARVLASLGCVDQVVIFDEPTPLRLIEAIAPDVLVKGADWPEEQIVGAREVRARGGAVLRIPFERDISTTDILRRIAPDSS